MKLDYILQVHETPQYDVWKPSVIRPNAEVNGGLECHIFDFSVLLFYYSTIFIPLLFVTLGLQQNQCTLAQRKLMRKLETVPHMNPTEPNESRSASNAANHSRRSEQIKSFPNHQLSLNKREQGRSLLFIGSHSNGFHSISDRSLILNLNFMAPC